MSVIERSTDWWRSERSTPWRAQRGVTTMYVITRLALFLIPLGLIPYYQGTLIPNDIVLYDAWAQVINSGHYPINDPMWQYPPLAGFVFLLGVNLAPSPIVGFMLLALIADAVMFWMFLRRGKATGDYTAAWTYVIAAAAIGPVFLTRFDIFPTLFAVAALLMLNKPIRSGMMLGIGALLKVWPAFLIVAHPRRSLGKVAAGMAAVGIAGMMMLSLWGPNFLSFLKEQGDRGLQVESAGGIFYIIGGFLGVHLDTIFRYGSMEIDAAGAGIIASIVTLAGFVAMGVIAYWRLRGRLERVPGADIALTIVLISIASSRVFSPQYMVWVAGLAAVVMLNRNTLMKPVVWLMLPVALAGQFVYPFAYGNMITGGWYGVLAQTIRIGALMVGTIWAFVIIQRQTRATTETEDHLHLDRDRPAVDEVDLRPTAIATATQPILDRLRPTVKQASDR